MQIAIQTGTTKQPLIFELSKEKVKFLIQFVNYLADDSIEEQSPEYKLFMENILKKAMKTKRVKSGNSLREIL